MSNIIPFPKEKQPWKRYKPELLWLSTKDIKFFVSSCQSMEDVMFFINSVDCIDEDEVTRLELQIKERGFTEPVIVNPNNEILIGHNLFKAAKRLKKPKILVSRAHNLADAMNINSLLKQEDEGDDHD